MAYPLGGMRLAHAADTNRMPHPDLRSALGGLHLIRVFVEET